MAKAIALANALNTEILSRIIEEKKNAVVKIGDTYEISRSLALELYKEIRSSITALGGSIREKSEILHASRDMVVMEFRIIVEIPYPESPEGKVVIEVSDVGDAYADEKGKKNILGRTALTRAMKRAMERLVGEDFINQTILRIFPQASKNEVPATERQIAYVKDLLEQTGTTLKDIGINKEMAEDLTYGEAKQAIEALKKTKRGG